MRLLIIRHADPDYSIDSLTETGWKEAELLADKMVHIKAKDYYVSPLGRAKDTASCTLKRLGREPIICDWLQEFPALVKRPDLNGERSCAWDWLPEDWSQRAKLLDRSQWKEVSELKEARVGEQYEEVCRQFDALLKEHGYARDGLLYRVENSNEDTLVFFCHFGLECVLLSHLMNSSPYVLWQGFCAAPSSVTTVYTEERREGIASFRAQSLGDISHLYVAGREPSFAARFCETYERKDQRHD
ncbi:MAG: histidine phosphatase family protein [bacterium]|nr:histidine phosphatase family protein [bacterium]